MATPRTRQDWLTIYAAAATTAGLSASAVAEWASDRDLFITMGMLQEGNVLDVRADVDTKLITQQGGSIYEYPYKVKQFQYGDTIQVDAKGVFSYAVTDATKQIVKVVNVKDNGDRTISVKVAKDNGSGGLTNLSTPELTALQNYLDLRAAPGVYARAMSGAGDTIKYVITGKYDRLYPQATILAALNAALTANQTSFGFDSVFYKAQLFEDLMAVTGMKDLVLRVDVTFSTGSVFSDLPDSIELPSGYYNWDVASSIALTAL